MPKWERNDLQFRSWILGSKLAHLQPPSFLPFHKEQFFFFFLNEKSKLKVIYHLHLDLLRLSHKITFTIPCYIQDFHFCWTSSSISFWSNMQLNRSEPSKELGRTCRKILKGEKEVQCQCQKLNKTGVTE